MGNASPLEITWSLIALCGMVASLLLLLRYLGDWRRVRASRLNGYRRIVTRGNVRMEAGRLVKLGALLCIGIVAMVTPSPTRVSNAVASYISGGFIIVVLLLISGEALLSYRDDRHIRQLLEAEDRAWHGKHDDGADRHTLSRETAE